MQRRFLTARRLAALICAAPLLACGNPTVDACERWRQSLLALECVPDDYEVGIDCSEYNDYPCDASPYFECLEGSYTCSEDGNFQSDTTACAALQGC